MIETNSLLSSSFIIASNAWGAVAAVVLSTAIFNRKARPSTSCYPYLLQNEYYSSQVEMLKANLIASNHIESHQLIPPQLEITSHSEIKFENKDRSAHIQM